MQCRSALLITIVCAFAVTACATHKALPGTLKGATYAVIEIDEYGDVIGFTPVNLGTLPTPRDCNPCVKGKCKTPSPDVCKVFAEGRIFDVKQITLIIGEGSTCYTTISGGKSKEICW